MTGKISTKKDKNKQKIHCIGGGVLTGESSSKKKTQTKRKKTERDKVRMPWRRSADRRELFKKKMKKTTAKEEEKRKKKREIERGVLTGESSSAAKSSRPHTSVQCSSSPNT